MFGAAEKFFKSEKKDSGFAEKQFNKPLPTIWLLGKTGAGKSTVIQSLTGFSKVQIGNGFAPCTKTAKAYDFPKEKSLLRFLDTRGFGEANYNPAEDISVCAEQSHALVIVAKIDDPEQSEVINALKKIKKQNKIKQLLVIHTAVNTISNEEKQRMQSFNQAQFEKAWGSEIPMLDVDLIPDENKFYHLDELIVLLSEMLPIVALVLDKNTSTSEEEHIFNQRENEILWYSGSASASDLIPVVGLVSVPGIQAKMLHSLASQYGIEWNKRMLGELTGTLGTSFAVQYGVKLGARQLVKLIPGYGQTVGAVTAAAMSFGTTYALGRAACYYFYQKNQHSTVNPEEMQKIYENAFKKGKKVAQ